MTTPFHTQARQAIADFEATRESEGSYPTARAMEQLEIAKTYALLAIMAEFEVQWYSPPTAPISDSPFPPTPMPEVSFTPFTFEATTGE